MEDLKSALMALGFDTFTPVFDGELKDLGGGRWFLGWEVRGSESQLLGCEAHFGLGEERDYWLSAELNPADPLLPLVRLPQREKIAAYFLAAKAIAAQSAAPQLYPLPTAEDFPRPPEQFDKSGKPLVPPQQLIANCLVGGLEQIFLRDVEDPFIWQGTHWQERNAKNFRRYVMRMGQGLRSGEAKHPELSAIHELFMNNAPSLEDSQTFYQQNPFLANFLDGTLEVQKVGGSYKKVFREHRQEDLLTWVLPYNYKAQRTRNKVFEDWIGKAFSADEDGAGKVRALKQIGGACLVSLFPRIAFLLSNKGGTGKSTFAKLCMKFMGPQNYSAVPPHLMESFNMESMIGKQANIVTDIGKKAVIPEDFMKLVEDGIPVFVNRKGRRAVFARLPALHLFCANALPRGIDGDSNAMDRRVSIVEFTKSMLGEGGEGYTRDFEEIIMAAGPGAVLDFFEDGLDDLLTSGGIYFNPESGKRILGDWKDSESFTAQFLDALGHGEVKLGNNTLVIDPQGRIERPKLSLVINEWAGKALHNQHMSRVFKELEDRGFSFSKITGKRYIHGLRESEIQERISTF